MKKDAEAQEDIPAFLASLANALNRPVMCVTILMAIGVAKYVFVHILVRLLVHVLQSEHIFDRSSMREKTRVKSHFCPTQATNTRRDSWAQPEVRS